MNIISTRCCTRPASFCFRFKCKQKLLNPKIIFVAKRIAIHELLLKIVLFASSLLHSIFYRLSFFRLFSQIFFRIFPFAQLFHNSIRRWIRRNRRSPSQMAAKKNFFLLAAFAKSSNTRRKNSAASTFFAEDLLRVSYSQLSHFRFHSVHRKMFTLEICKKSK